MVIADMGKHKYCVHFVLIASVLPGCTSIEPVDYSFENIRAELEIGDRVEITTNSGEEYNFTIVGLPEAEIAGEEVTVSYQEIEDIEATRISDTGKAVTVIGGTVIIGAVIWAYIIRPIVTITSFASLGG